MRVLASFVLIWSFASVGSSFAFDLKGLEPPVWAPSTTSVVPIVAPVWVTPHGNWRPTAADMEGPFVVVLYENRQLPLSSPYWRYILFMYVWGTQQAPMPIYASDDPIWQPRINMNLHVAFSQTYFQTGGTTPYEDRMVICEFDPATSNWCYFDPSKYHVVDTVQYNISAPRGTQPNGGFTNWEWKGDRLVYGHYSLQPNESNLREHDFRIPRTFSLYHFPMASILSVSSVDSAQNVGFVVEQMTNPWMFTPMAWHFMGIFQSHPHPQLLSGATAHNYLSTGAMTHSGASAIREVGNETHIFYGVPESSSGRNDLRFYTSSDTPAYSVSRPAGLVNDGWFAENPHIAYSNRLSAPILVHESRQIEGVSRIETFSYDPVLKQYSPDQTIDLPGYDVTVQKASLSSGGRVLVRVRGAVSGGPGIPAMVELP